MVFLIKKRLPLLLALVLLSFGTIRASESLKDTAVSIDELQHIATGFEWLENKTYELEALHPPLARIISALPLYIFKNVRLGQGFYTKYCPMNLPKDYKKEYEGRIKGGKAIFCGLNESEHTERVILARISSLLFFTIGGLGIYAWSRSAFNARVACLATFFYSNLPIILASCVIINTDMAGSAFLIWTLYFIPIWLKAPTNRNSLVVGMLIGIVAISKFSSIIFLGLCFAVLGLYLGSQNKKLISGLQLSEWRSRLIIILSAFTVIWSAYHFSTEEVFGLNILPFPEFFRGLGELIARNKIPFLGYIFGKILLFKGVWYFFPVATFFKTPLSFLLMFLGSIWLAMKLRTKQIILILLLILSIYFIGAASNINIGLRHMLPAFMLMCITNAHFVDYCWHRFKNLISKFAIIAAIFSYLLSSAIAHKDYISYFNIMAGNTPEDILIEGDFDIGQDAKKLADYLSSAHIMEKTVFYSYNIVHPDCYGITHYKILFGANRKEFKVEFGTHKYLAIAKVVPKFLPQAALREINQCTNPIYIGETIIIFDKKNCRF